MSIQAYAKIDMTNPGSGVGTVVNIQLMSDTDAQDSNFTWVATAGIVCSDSTPIRIGATYNGTVFSPPAPPPAAPYVPLNQQYTPIAFGQMLISNFSQSNAQRGLTAVQIFTLAQTLLPYALLLQTGSLQTFVNELPNIPVDGVLVTNALIAQYTATVNAYLNGN